MKANELMLGDWVYGLYPNGKRYEPPFRISAVDIYPTNRSPRIVTEGGYGFQEEHLAPIPLTPEILEKNGWRQYSPYFSNDNADFELEPYRDGGFGIRVSADEYGSGTFACIKYVHQLQHVLRLCGIEKEITL